MSLQEIKYSVPSENIQSILLAGFEYAHPKVNPFEFDYLNAPPSERACMLGFSVLSVWPVSVVDLKRFFI